MKYGFVLLLLAFGSLSLSAGSEEAKRFFAEYQAQTSTAAKKEKLDAALALDPTNEYYRYEEVEFYSSFCYSRNWDTWIANAREQLRLTKKFHADFPNYRNDDWNRKLVFAFHRVFQRQPFRHLYGRTNPPTAKQAKEMEELCDELRPLTRMEEERIWYSSDLADGISSRKELQNYAAVVYHYSQPEFYGSQERFWQERLKGYSGLLDAMEEFVRKHPEERKKVEEIGTFDWFDDMALPDGDIQTDDAVSMRCLSREIDPLLGRMEQSTFPGIRSIATRFRLYQALTRAPRDRESAFRVLEEFLKKHPDGDWLDAAYWPMTNLALSSFSGWWIGTSRLAGRVEEHYRQLRTRSFPETIKDLFQKEDWAGLSARADEMREERKRRIAGLRVENPYVNIAAAFSHSPKLPDAAWKFFKQMNADFRIESRSIAELFGSGKPIQATGVCKRGETIFLLLDQERKFFLGVCDISLTRGTLYPLSPEPSAFDGLYPGFFGTKKPTPWDCNGSLAAIALRNGDLLLYDLKRKREHIIRDILPAPARGVAIVGNKVYALCGQEGASQENYLVSCNLSGEDYRIHFSNVRSEKKNELEHAVCEVNSLFACNNNELIFLLGTQQAKVFRYRIDADRFEVVCDLGKTSNRDRMYRDDNIFYAQNDGHGFLIQQVDPEKDRAYCILMQNDRYKGIQAPFCRSWMVQGPFARQNNLLFGAGWFTTVVDLSDPAKSPQLFMPASGFLISGQNGAVIYFSEFRYFEVAGRSGACFK